VQEELMIFVRHEIHKINAENMNTDVKQII
jgi:hypothetical protein